MSADHQIFNFLKKWRAFLLIYEELVDYVIELMFYQSKIPLRSVIVVVLFRIYWMFVL